MSETRTAPRTALRVVLYDPEGVPVRARPIDARELIASGYTEEPPAPAKAPAKAEATDKAPAKAPAEPKGAAKA